MATPIPLPATVFTPAATTFPGQTVSQTAVLSPTQPAIAAGTVNFIAATVQQAIVSDTVANTPGSTALPLPNNFTFTDLTAKVSGAITGDAFKGVTSGVTSQFIDLTPDNLLIQAVTPNAFLKTDTGNDILIATAGRNVFNAGSGNAVFVGGSGQDTFLADATKASASATLLNFASSDDAALLGISLANFTLSATDTLAGLEIDANPIAATNPIKASMTLQGYTTADITSNKLILGLGSTADGTPFLFTHAT